jgi:hypothetical protein
MKMFRLEKFYESVGHATPIIAWCKCNPTTSMIELHLIGVAQFENAVVRDGRELPRKRGWQRCPFPWLPW